MGDNDTPTKVNNDVQDSAKHDHHNHDTSKPVVKDNWIKIADGKFICSECENESEPETNTEEGTVTANLDQIKADLKEFPTKVVYGICPICGMEFVFKLVDEELYLEPSELQK